MRKIFPVTDLGRRQGLAAEFYGRYILQRDTETNITFRYELYVSRISRARKGSPEITKERLTRRVLSVPADFVALDTETIVSAQKFQANHDEMLRGFYALFPERLDTIVRSIGGTTWRVASRFYSLSDEDIQECISRSGKLLRGAMPGDRCRFTVLTIAAGSELQNAAAVSRIREALAQIGIKKTRLCRASGSDDWQIFIWWSEWIDTNELQQKFVDWMAQAQLDPLFVFPGTRPLPLPLQSGFAWLDDQAALVTVREDLSLDQALEMFLKDMSGGVNDWTVVSERIAALSKTLPGQHDELAQVADQVVESPSPEHQETAAESSNSAANEESVDEILDFAPPTGEVQKIISDIEPSCNTEISTQDLSVSVNIETSQPELSEPIEYAVAFKSDPIVPKAFIDPKGTDRESVVVPEEIAACESMQQLSLFSLEPLERGPPP